MRPSFALAVCLAACEPADDGLVTALPDPLLVTVHAPPGDAVLLTSVRLAIDGVNDLVGGVVGDLHEITRTPPAEQGPGWAAWGPMTPPLSPVTYRVVVQAIAPGFPTFRLEARGDDGYRPLLWGIPGAFFVDLDLGHALDPVRYPEPGRLDVRFSDEGVHIEHAGGEVSVGRTPDGAGWLALARPDELLHAAWAADGAGRAEARRGDGTVVVECWDTRFVVVPCAQP